ncbi:MAG: hypothetical protein ABIV94_02610 [Acidimicrobiales bacterium]
MTADALAQWTIDALLFEARRPMTPELAGAVRVALEHRIAIHAERLVDLIARGAATWPRSHELGYLAADIADMARAHGIAAGAETAAPTTTKETST